MIPLTSSEPVLILAAHYGSEGLKTQKEINMNALKRMNPLRKKVVLVVSLTVVVLCGVTAYAAIVGPLGSGNIAHSETLDGPATVTMRTLSFAPGEVGVWHYHPGPLFNVVTQGTVTVEDGCGGEQSYTVGQAFEEGGRVHRPKNLGGVPTFAYQTFVVPLGNPTTLNISGNERLCGPVRSVEECKDNGWMKFTFPHAFNNQGECVAFVEGAK
jgi:quercetin dioxygenase-like cupin family protein